MGVDLSNEIRRLGEGLSSVEGAGRFRLLSKIARHCVQEILDGEKLTLARIGIEMLLNEKVDGKPRFSDADRGIIAGNIQEGLSAEDECREISAVEDVEGGIGMCERPIGEWPHVVSNEEPEPEPKRGHDYDWSVDFGLIFGCKPEEVDK